jgi:hypothetical protein
VFLHLYVDIDHDYSARQYLDHVVGARRDGRTRFDEAGIQVVLYDSAASGVKDLKASLGTRGAVVVYMGHSVLDKSKALGLLPVPRRTRTVPALSAGALTTLLTAAKAKVVLLAACASDTCVRRLRSDLVLIATSSGRDLETNTTQWAPAIKAFLDALMVNGTAGEAFEAANAAFTKVSSTDRFRWISGDKSLKLF